GQLNARDSVTVSGVNANLLSGGIVQTLLSDGIVTFTTPTGNILIASASLQGLNSGELLATNLVYFLASSIEMDGLIVTAAKTVGRVRMDSVNNTVVSGIVNASGAAEVFAGVHTDWTTAQLRDNPIAVATLAATGNAEVEGSGQLLSSNGQVTFEAGGN